MVITESKILGRIKGYDIRLFSWCMALKYRPQLAQLGRTISRTGDGYYYAIVALLLAVSSLSTPENFFSVMAAAFIVERLCYLAMKLGFKRNRPADTITGFDSWVKPADQFSFPSGHTSAAFLFSGFMIHLFPGTEIAFYTWAVTVGLSRFVLGVHFITDIMMGMLIGYFISTFFISSFLV